VLAGVGLVGFIDETVFHQLLHWHHFYDKSTLAVGLVSDGVPVQLKCLCDRTCLGSRSALSDSPCCPP
jgi:uncharacterized membrane protein